MGFLAAADVYCFYCTGLPHDLVMMLLQHMRFPFDSCVLCAISVEHNFREPARTQIRQLLESQRMVLDVQLEHDDFYLREGYQGHLGQRGVDATRTMAAA